MCAELGVALLGSLPLDPVLARCCDAGTDFLLELPASPAVTALRSIVASKSSFWAYESDKQNKSHCRKEYFIHFIFHYENLFVTEIVATCENTSS